MKKIFFTFILCFLLITTSKALEINSKYAVLYNLNDTSIVYELNKDEKTSIASLTKIMTTIVALENISDYNAKVSITKEMLNGLEEQGAATIGIKEGQILTYNDLLYGVLLASGADAARALAISISQSEEDFVQKMNEKALNLGLKNTHFTGTVGLDDENHYSTVSDVAKILMYALKNPKFKEIFTTDSYTFSDNTFTVKSTMRQTGKAYHLDTKNILGGKTGFTSQAGRCLATIAYDKQNDINYLLVTTNASKVPDHLYDALNIYDYYFNNYKFQTLIDTNDILVTLKTKYSKTKEIQIKSPEKITKYLNNNYSKDDLQIVYQGEKIITPTMAKGTQLGTVNIKYKDEIIKKLPVTLPKKIKYSFLGFLMAYKFIIILAIIIIIFIIIWHKKKVKIK